MELLLNLTWLLLAMPAYWLWRSSKGAAEGRRLTALQCLFSLACALVILFPVISATDDLCVMRAEIEESPSTKRSICHKSTQRICPGKWLGQPSLALSSSFSVPADDAWHLPPTSARALTSAPAIERTGRAPPPLPLA